MMIRQLGSTKLFFRTFSQVKPSVATEEFPFKAILTPQKAATSSIKESKHSSGLRIISRETNVPIVNFKFAILGGSRAETGAQKGSAHFLAAAAYAGNHKNSGLRIVRYLESLGADVTANADREKIVYDVSVLADKADSAFSAVATAISTPPYADHVWNEDGRHVVDTQYEVHHYNTKNQLIELLHEAAYGETSPLGGSLLALNVDRLSTKDIKEYRQKHFVADNIIVAADGLSHDKLSALVDQYVSGGKIGSVSSHSDIELEVAQIAKSATPVTPLANASPYVGGVAKLRLDLDGESHVGIAFPTPAGEAGKPFVVLHSILAQKFGAENVFFRNYSSGGIIGYYSVGDAKEVGAHLENVISEIKTIAAGVKNSAAKTEASLSHFLALEGSNTTRVFLDAAINGITAQNFGDFRGITADQVSNAAKDVLKSVPSYAVLGTTAYTPTYDSILKLWK